MRRENSFNGGFSMVKGVGLSVAVSLFLTVVFACVLRYCSLSSKVIYPVNQGIKVFSIALGVLLFVRGEKGWLKGGSMGLLFTALTYFAFSAIGGDFSLSLLAITELLAGALAGAISGMIAVNLRRGY